MASFFESIMSIPAPFNMIVAIVLIGSVAGVIITIAKNIRQYHCHHEELELKREMLERGMSAEEIEQVIRAKGPSGLES
jgi:hypothetical protein